MWARYDFVDAFLSLERETKIFIMWEDSLPVRQRNRNGRLEICNVVMPCHLDDVGFKYAYWCCQLLTFSVKVSNNTLIPFLSRISTLSHLHNFSRTLRLFYIYYKSITSRSWINIITFPRQTFVIIMWRETIDNGNSKNFSMTSDKYIVLK